MNWPLVLWVIAVCASQTLEQRRALVHYSLSSPEEVDPVSENPLSSSINSIQTGREELIALHRADIGLGGTALRGHHKTTTPDYFKEPVSDSTNTGKTHSGPITKSPEADTKVPGNGSRNNNSGKVEETGTYEVPTHNRRDGEASLFKDKRSSGFESPSPSRVTPEKRNHSEAERSSQEKDEVKTEMDINKGTALREQDRRSNTHESRRQTTTPSFSSSVGFNVSMKERSERHRDELSEKNHNERLNRERRPSASVESTRGHRTVVRTALDKGQTLTHNSTQRISTTHRYDRTEQPATSAVSHDKKTLDRTLDSRDSFKNVDERQKVSDGESGPPDKTLTENEGGVKIRGNQTNSSIPNKPTHLLIGEQRPRSPDVYRDEFRGGVQDDSIGKVGSDTDKSSGGGDGKIYSERPYGRDDDGRPSTHQSKDRDTDYTRGQRDRYDERSYEERPLKISQTRRDREQNATYYSQDRTANRSSRPRDGSYDDEYRDDGYKPRDSAMQDSDDISKGQTRMGGRPYTKTDDVDRDRYADDSTRNYRDYSDDRRYRDERAPTDRASSRRYRGEENRRYREDRRRTYDDYEGKDRYDSRFGTDGESRLYSENVTRSYSGSGPHRYEGEEGRRSRTESDRLPRRYKDSELIYNSTERYRDYYDGYRDDNRRSSGDSGSSSRYGEADGTRSSRYDDEEYKDRRSHSARDSDQKYVRRDDEGTSRQRDPPRYREDYEDGTYRGETSVYSEISSTDRYNQEKRRTFGGADPDYSGTRLETNDRRDYDNMNNDSRKLRGDGNYRSIYVEDVYYNNRTTTGNTDRYGESDRSRRRTDDDSSGYEASDNRKYTPRTSDERRRDRDYEENPLSRRLAESDNTRKDTSRTRDEDHYQSRADSYDERTYRSRDGDDDEYIRSSRDRVKDYDSRSYRDSDDDDTRSYKVRGDDDAIDRYRGDDIVRDQVSDDEFKNTRPVSGRDRDKDYIDRRYEEGYREKGSEGTYRYREEDEKHRYAPSEDRKVEYSDPERRNRGTQRFQDHYESSGRDSNIPRSADDRRRGTDRSNRREDRHTDDQGDFNNKAPDRSSTKVDTARRGDTKSEFPTLRDGDSPLRERSNPYAADRTRDGTRSQTRDIQQGVRTSGTQYTSHSDDLPPKTRVSEDRPDTFDKGDFARGRRTSFYSDDDKGDSDRDALGKGSRDDRGLPRTGKREEVSYAQNEKGPASTYDTRDLRQSDRSDPRSYTGQSQIYSNRRDIADTSRHKTKDEIPASRIPSDLLPTSEDAEYFEKTEDAAKRPISQSNDETQRRRYPSSSYDGGGRRRLPNLRESEVDRPTRRDDPEYKTEDPASLPENRGRYRYTKSRGDREDFSRHTDEGSLVSGDEYISRGTGSKDLDANRRDTLKGEYGSPGPGTPTRNKEDRIPSETGHKDKEEYYHSGREKVPPTNGKPGDDIPALREFAGHENVPRDRDIIGHENRGVYENGDHRRSSPQDETKFRGENTTSDRFESPNRDVHLNKENVPFSLVVSQTVPSTRVQGSSISRTATPIPHQQDKEFISRNISSKINSDRIIGSSVNREKRFQYDDRLGTNNTARSVATDELSKRPLSTKEVIDAAYRHSDEPKESREVFYPVYVPGSSNMTDPDVIRPSERRGITTPTKKKKKK